MNQFSLNVQFRKQSHSVKILSIGSVASMQILHFLRSSCREYISSQNGDSIVHNKNTYCASYCEHSYDYHVN